MAGMNDYMYPSFSTNAFRSRYTVLSAVYRQKVGTQAAITVFSSALHNALSQSNHGFGRRKFSVARNAPKESKHSGIAARLFKRGASFNGIVEAHRTKPSSHSVRRAHQTHPVPTSNRAKDCRHHVARVSKSRPPIMDGLKESETFTGLAFDQRQYS
jgi:hypothetical protein